MLSLCLGDQHFVVEGDFEYLFLLSSASQVFQIQPNTTKPSFCGNGIEPRAL